MKIDYSKLCWTQEGRTYSTQQIDDKLHREFPPSNLLYTVGSQKIVEILVSKRFKIGRYKMRKIWLNGTEQ